MVIRLCFKNVPMATTSVEDVTHINGELGPCLDEKSEALMSHQIYPTHIWNIKHELIAKLITEFFCKLRDESSEHN